MLHGTSRFGCFEVQVSLEEIDVTKRKTFARKRFKMTPGRRAMAKQGELEEDGNYQILCA